MSDRWERWVREALKGKQLREPQPGVLRKALAIGSRLGELAESRSPWWVALVFDSAAQPLPAGVRGSSSQRRLLYEARPEEGSEAACQLDLRLRRLGDGKLELTGQVLPPPLDPMRVEARCGKVCRRKELRKSGEFLLRGLPGSAATVRLTLHDDSGPVLILPAIGVSPPERE
jgi:hypothetical protein